MTSSLPVPAGDLPANMPGPRDLAKALQHSLETHIGRVREDRGTVTTPEDTYSLIRSLAASKELLDDYASAFSKAGKLAKAEMEWELSEAVGELDGVPTGGMTVPDANGDVRLFLDQTNSYSFDVEQLVSVAISATFQQQGEPLDDELYAKIAGCMHNLLEMGNFTPQIAKVKAVAGQLSRQGDDKLASVLTSSFTKTTNYRGVKSERKANGTEEKG